MDPTGTPPSPERGETGSRQSGHAELLHAIEEAGRCREECILGMLPSGQMIGIVPGPGEQRLGIFARARRRGDRAGFYTGPYRRYDFDGGERSWRHGNGPPGARQIRAVVLSILDSDPALGGPAAHRDLAPDPTSPPQDMVALVIPVLDPRADATIDPAIASEFEAAPDPGREQIEGTLATPDPYARAEVADAGAERIEEFSTAIPHLTTESASTLGAGLGASGGLRALPAHLRRSVHAWLSPLGGFPDWRPPLRKLRTWPPLLRSLVRSTRRRIRRWIRGPQRVRSEIVILRDLQRPTALREISPPSESGIIRDEASQPV